MYTRHQSEHGTITPPYQGSSFSYHEDALESPVDTDFTALVAIHISCNSIISELERMALAVSEISGYLKTAPRINVLPVDD